MHNHVFALLCQSTLGARGIQIRPTLSLDSLSVSLQHNFYYHVNPNSIWAFISCERNISNCHLTALNESWHSWLQCSCFPLSTTIRIKDVKEPQWQHSRWLYAITSPKESESETYLLLIISDMSHVFNVIKEIEHLSLPQSGHTALPSGIQFHKWKLFSLECFSFPFIITR